MSDSRHFSKLEILISYSMDTRQQLIIHIEAQVRSRNGLVMASVLRAESFLLFDVFNLINFPFKSIRF